MYDPFREITMTKQFIALQHSIRNAGIYFVVGALTFVFSPAAHTQCPYGSDQDSLGCPNQLSTSEQKPTGPAAMNVEEREQTATPAADKASDASAENSLSAGTGYIERSALKGRIGDAAAPLPEAPTEFQKFVQASTGRSLPIYGASLFSEIRASFDPIVNGPAPDEMVIGPDDELRIRVWGQVNFSANLRVSREGEIYLPKIGAVRVAGLPFASVASHLKSVMDGVYRNYEMSVDLGEIHTIQLYMTGLARKPGAYTVSALSTLIDSVFLSGGPSPDGSMRHVQLRRGGKVITDFDLYTLIAKGDKTGDVQL
jgi:hypothetical protein